MFTNESRTSKVYEAKTRGLEMSASFEIRVFIKIFE
jgi:hypothetical protein